jgi:hypothetical protein
MVETELQMAERHVREGRRHIARQKEIIQKLRSLGAPTDDAETLLAIFASLQKQHLAHVARLSK